MANHSLTPSLTVNENRIGQQPELPIHPHALLFPELTEEEYQSLKLSIENEGLIDPIAVYNDHLLDGRHRYRACRELGIEPRVDVLPLITDTLQYVIAKNVVGRHLTTSQRALIAAEMVTSQQGRPEKTPDGVFFGIGDAASLFGVGTSSVDRARYLIKHATAETIRLVRVNEVSLGAAEKIVRRAVHVAEMLIETLTENQGIALNAKDEIAKIENDAISSFSVRGLSVNDALEIAEKKAMSDTAKVAAAAEQRKLEDETQNEEETEEHRLTPFEHAEEFYKQEWDEFRQKRNNNNSSDSRGDSDSDEDDAPENDAPENDASRKTPLDLPQSEEQHDEPLAGTIHLTTDGILHENGTPESQFWRIHFLTGSIMENAYVRISTSQSEAIAMVAIGQTLFVKFRHIQSAATVSDLIPEAKRIVSRDAATFDEMASRYADKYWAAAVSDDEVGKTNTQSAPQNKRRPGGGSSEFYTPPFWVERVRTAMDSIDFDPASSAVAQTIVEATCYLTAAEDALAPDTQWRGPNVFINPPYAQETMRGFSRRLLDEIEAGVVEQAIWLSNAVVDTQYGQELLRKARIVLFPKGRIGFFNEQLEVPGPGPAASMLIGLGPKLDVDRFVDVFRGHGTFLTPWQGK